MSKRKGHRHNKKHKRRHRHSSSSSTYSSDSDTNSSRSSRIKSGAFRKYADRVSISLKWPNEFIGRTDGVSPTYQDLTFTEFMFGIVSGLLEQTPSLHQNRDPDLDGCNPSAANPLPYTNADDYHADPLRYLQFQHNTVPPLSQGDLLSPDDYPSDASSDTYDTDVPLPEAPPTLDRHPVPPRDQVFNLPRGFLASHPTLHLAERADPQLLPSVPVCPGPYLPLYPSRLHRPLATAILHQFFPHQAIIFKQVTSHGLPNYLGAKITVGVNFPLQVWKDLLHNHSDPQVVMFMEFGWPTSYMDDQMPTLQLDNHASATRHPTVVAKYLDKEVRLGGLMGPFPSSPFQWTRLNPLWPAQRRVPKTCALSSICLFRSTFPLTARSPEPYMKGRRINCGSYMSKVDLARAYRQLPSDPFDWSLLGLSWELATFIDLAIPFGLRHGAMACQRVTEAICFIRRQCATTLPYIDDFGGSASKSKRQANNQYLMLKTVILELGLAISWDKCEPPTRFMTWVGTTFDSLLMVMSIERDKIEEALDLCIRYLASDQISLHDLESLLGKLLYSSKLANPAQRFLNRTLHFRRSFASPRPKDIPQDVKEDLHWFRRFLPHYNGRAISLSRLHPSQHLYTDTSLVGGGAYIRGHEFSTVWPQDVVLWEVAINELELFTVLVALRRWSPFLSGCTTQVWTDHQTCVTCLRSGKSRNPFLAACLRELWHICATEDIYLLFSHIPGADNQTADLLS